MTPGEAAKWTAESVREWARDLFASRDEAIKIAREEARNLETKIIRLETRVNDAVPTLLTRSEYEQRHRELQDAADQRLRVHIEEAERRFNHNEDRLDAIESWKANVTGRVVGLGAIGVIFTAVVTAVVIHLAGG